MATDTVQVIREALLTRMASVLTGWTKLKYQWDVSQNSFQGNDKRYGVRVSSGNEIEGTTCHYLMDHNFSLVLVKGYVTATQNDDNIITTIDTLMEACHDLYKSIADDKAGTSPTVVVRVSDLSIDAPVIYNEQKVIEQVANMNISYRVRIR